MATRIERDGVELELVGPVPEQSPRRPQTTRTKARKRALDILFEAEVRALDPLVVLNERSHDDSAPVRTFTSELVHGVVEHGDEIDRAIAAVLDKGWKLGRMPRVDRNLCRLAVFEIGHTDIADKVAVAEAVALAESLSTDDSAGFVNGVLGRILRSATTQG